MPNDLIVVWFSCGAASAVALKLTVDTYGIDRVRAMNQPIVEEGEDNRRFARDVGDWCGIEIEEFSNPKYPSNSAVDVWDHRGAMVFPHGAPCTRHLKKDARYLFESGNWRPDWHVFGFTADERSRYENFRITERDNLLPILHMHGMSKVNCAITLRNAGLELPIAYKQGYPNANCKGCVKATSPTYWNLVRVTDPDVFWARAEQSRKLGVRLVRVKGKRIFLDELHPDTKGRPLKSMPDCGITCEEHHG